MLQPGGQVFLQPPYYCVIGPPGLGEKTLHRPGGDAHRFGEILGVAPLPGLHQQGLKIVPAVLPPLLASEGVRKKGVKFLKAVVDPLEARRIHHPNRPPSSGQLSYQTTRRCNTRGRLILSVMHRTFHVAPHPRLTHTPVPESPPRYTILRQKVA